jgi:hypothetical protein
MVTRTLANCGADRKRRADWIQPAAVGDLPDEWLSLARRQAKAVDAVVRFARSASLKWQTTVALNWIERIIDGRLDLIANHLWLLEEWLSSLRSEGLIVAEVKSTCHRIVDGLAAIACEVLFRAAVQSIDCTLRGSVDACLATAVDCHSRQWADARLRSEDGRVPHDRAGARSVRRRLRV